MVIVEEYADGGTNHRWNFLKGFKVTIVLEAFVGFCSPSQHHTLIYRVAMSCYFARSCIASSLLICEILVQKIY